MPRDLFGDVSRPRPSVNTRKWYTVPLSLIAHVALLVPLVLAPLLAADALPMVRDLDSFISAKVIPPDPPPPPRPPANPGRKPRPARPGLPIEAPPQINPEPPTPFEDGTPIDAVIPGLPDVDVIAAAPPAPPPPPPAAPTVYEVGGKIRPPVRLRGVAPVYPPIAQSARVEGTVILQATIDTEGNVQDLKVLRSIPLLDQAAIEAVRQWQYSPTLLNGAPVSVIMTVTVTFALQR